MTPCRRRSDGGTNLFCLRVADITIALICEGRRLRLGCEAATKDFLVGEAELDAKVRTWWGDLSNGIGGQSLFNPGVHWQLYWVGGSYVFSFSSRTLGPVPYKVASFNPDFTYGDVRLHRPFFPPGRPVDPLGYPLSDLLMLNLLSRGRGVEIHACGAVDSAGNGYLFAGQSGAGKTTIARLLHRAGGVTVLSDDRIILRKLGGTLWMYGTPWHGDAGFASPARAPLKQIYFLQHGRENELIPQRPAEAVGRLFACSFPLFYDRDALDFTLGFLGEVVRAVPCHELKFVPNEKVVDFINGLSAGE